MSKKCIKVFVVGRQRRLNLYAFLRFMQENFGFAAYLADDVSSLRFENSVLIHFFEHILIWVKFSSQSTRPFFKIESKGEKCLESRR